MFTVKIKKLHNDAKIPEIAHKGDAGMDLFSIENIEIPSGEIRLIKTGISMELPSNSEAQIRPRSGLALKHGITVLNSPGTIDCGYRGEIGVILINHSKIDFKVEKGMKIAQMVIKPIYDINVDVVMELTDTDRGSNGYGSSGI